MWNYKITPIVLALSKVNVWDMEKYYYHLSYDVIDIEDEFDDDNVQVKEIIYKTIINFGGEIESTSPASTVIFFIKAEDEKQFSSKHRQVRDSILKAMYMNFNYTLSLMLSRTTGGAVFYQKINKSIQKRNQKIINNLLHKKK